MDPIQFPSTTADAAAPSWYDSRLYKSCMAAWPILKVAFIVAMAIGGFYLWLRDTNTAQAINVTDLRHDIDAVNRMIETRTAARDKQIEEMKKGMLTREVYEAYHQSDVQRLDDIRSTLNQMIQNQQTR